MSTGKRMTVRAYLELHGTKSKPVLSAPVKAMPPHRNLHAVPGLAPRGSAARENRAQLSLNDFRDNSPHSHSLRLCAALRIHWEQECQIRLRPIGARMRRFLTDANLDQRRA